MAGPQPQLFMRLGALLRYNLNLGNTICCLKANPYNLGFHIYNLLYYLYAELFTPLLLLDDTYTRISFTLVLQVFRCLLDLEGRVTFKVPI